jgi:LacI family transcriptional regulator
MSTRLTMQDIADQLGLSRQTVSYIINGKAAQRGISEKTVEKVNAYLEETGYIPSRHALNLKNGEKGSIGLLHKGYLYSHLLEAFNITLGKLNWSPRPVEIMMAKKDESVSGVQELIARGTSQVIWFQNGAPEYEFTNTDILFNYLNNLETLVVYNYNFGYPEWDELLKEKGIHMIGINREKVFNEIGTFLKELGHEKAALPQLYRQHQASLFAQMEQGLRSAGMEVFFTLPDPHIKYGNPDYFPRMVEGIIKGMKEQGITAACFGDDDYAGHAMAELAERGVRVPDDITVTGFDGMEHAALFSIPLTTMKVPVREMVGFVEFLLTTQTDEYTHCFDAELIERKSHKKTGNRKQETGNS